MHSEARRMKEAMDRTKLIADFLSAVQSSRVGFLTMGKVRFEIERTLSPDEELFVVLQNAGASKSSISNAKYARDAWQRVMDGRITEEQYWSLSFKDTRALSRLEKHPFAIEVVLAGAAAGLEYEETVALGKWNLRGAELIDLAKQCAERELSAPVIAAGAMLNELPKSNAARIESLGSGCKITGPAMHVSAILRWAAKQGGPQAISNLDFATLKVLGDTFLPLLPIMSAITQGLRGEKVLLCGPDANRGDGIVRAVVQ